ncbi:hypothetical protein [Dyella telluris]|uniref:Uncharacterized protein n=1 Tax=Dyella telluris TaxID=2763498 RepID=A0A7G8Q1S5_9GAMM|nr:hypothetical protein [Dyella telluris]QNK00733.1 hypothetical protein H8F01_16820 [Dyella telluris]
MRTADEQRALTDAMRAELEPMTLREALAWGNGHFGALDNMLVRLAHNADGTPADTFAAADALRAWAERIQAFAAIVQAKAPQPPKRRD